MEFRTGDFYTRQPCLLSYCLQTVDGNYIVPETTAIALAILDRKNVVLKPGSLVFLHGQVGVPPESNPDVDWYQYVDTSFIQSVYFERVRENGKTSYHCYVKTLNTTYLVWDDPQSRMKPMKNLVNYIQERNLKFEDFKDYFTEINENYHDVEIIPAAEMYQ